MQTAEESTARVEATKSLERMQKFDVTRLPREAELGSTLSFEDAVPPAKRLIDLYKRLSIEALDDFAAQQLSQLRNVANQDYSLLEQIIDFTADQANPAQARQNLIQQLVNTYAGTFTTLHPLIAYSLHRSADFQRLDREARGTLQSVRDHAETLTKDLAERLDNANRIVDEVRKVAAEAGVSQQAIYFKEDADSHKQDAEKWQHKTAVLAWVLGIYAFLSLFIAKIPFLRPDDTYQSIQLGISKLLIFAVISFMLYLAARNFLSHKHNTIVNRHRQNALMTYKTLADAAAGEENREVVLTHAAACIFAPQPTGYSTDSGTDMAKATSVVEVLGKTFRADK